MISSISTEEASWVAWVSDSLPVSSFLRPRAGCRQPMPPRILPAGSPRLRLFPQRLQLRQSLPCRRFAGFHHLDEGVEQVGGVVGAGAGFGVVLHGEDRKVFVAEAFDGAVVEVDVGDYAA